MMYLSRKMFLTVNSPLASDSNSPMISWLVARITWNFAPLSGAPFSSTFFTLMLNS